MSGEAWALGYREYISVKQQVSIQVSNTASIVEQRCQKIHAALLSVGSNFEDFFSISLGLSLVCFTLLQEFWILVIQTFETLKPESVAYTGIVVQRHVGRSIGRKSHEINEIIINFYWSAALKYKMFSYRAAGSALCCITFALKASSVPYYPGYLWTTFFFLHPGLFYRMT